MSHYDAIVLGTGGVGSAALFHLARRGLRVLGLDRFGPGHDRGSSHGHTRIIRKAYFEHTDYVPLLIEAYRLWDELEALAGRQLYHQIGVLQIGPADGYVLRGLAAAAEQHNLPLVRMSDDEIMREFPGFRVNAEWEGLLEREAGVLRVEACVVAHLNAAQAAGAELQTGVEVQSWRADGTGVVVETDVGRFSAERLVIAAGAWSSQVLADLGLPLQVVRKPQYWFRPESGAYSADEGYPAYLYETPDGIFYGVSQLDGWGVKVAEHTGGPAVADPLTVDRELDAVDRARIGQFAARYLPDLTSELVYHAVCMYTLTPDQHFVIDRHPRHAQVAFAAGLSGHGFKFTPVLGKALADLAIDGRTALPIGFLSMGRFKT